MSTSPLDRLAAHLGERFSPHTKRAFLAQAGRFLTRCGVQAIYSREEVLAYVDDLILAHYRSDSIHTMLAGVRALFYANHTPWPLDARDLRLGLPQETPLTPTLSPDEVGRLIKGCRDTPGFPQVVVALATVYGLRGDEILRCLAVGHARDTLSVQTAKGGQKREHRIPSTLVPILTFPAWRVSARLLHDLFERQMRSFVREPAAREGWHACRRSVITGLLQNGVAERDVHRWFGWREDRKITYHYYHPDPLVLDRTIYRAHPYLGYWTSPAVR